MNKIISGLLVAIATIALSGTANAGASVDTPDQATQTFEFSYTPGDTFNVHMQVDDGKVTKMSEDGPKVTGAPVLYGCVTGTDVASTCESDPFPLYDSPFSLSFPGTAVSTGTPGFVEITLNNANGFRIGVHCSWDGPHVHPVNEVLVACDFVDEPRSEPVWYPEWWVSGAQSSEAGWFFHHIAFTPV